eukprot:131282_1
MSSINTKQKEENKKHDTLGDRLFAQFLKCQAKGLQTLLVTLGISALTIFSLCGLGDNYGKGLLSLEDISFIFTKCAEDLSEAMQLIEFDYLPSTLTKIKRRIYYSMANILYDDTLYGMSAYQKFEMLPSALVWYVESKLGGTFDVVAHFRNQIIGLGAPTWVLHVIGSKFRAKTIFSDFRVHEFEFMQPSWNVQFDNLWFIGLLEGKRNVEEIYKKMQSERECRHSQYNHNKQQKKK